MLTHLKEALLQIVGRGLTRVEEKVYMAFEPVSYLRKEINEIKETLRSEREMWETELKFSISEPKRHSTS